MENVGNWIWVVIAFSGYVFIHELGHFIAAKRVGVRVEVFSLGFGPFLFSFRKGETLYALSLIPLGGYVKMAGQSDLGPDANTGKDYEYSSKPPFQRMQIAVAGVIMNFIGGFAAFVVAYLVGVNAIPPVANEIEPGSPAAVAGIRPGDRIVSINGSPVWRFEDIFVGLVGRGSSDAVLVLRAPDGSRRSIAVQPDMSSGKPVLGISPYMPARIGAETSVRGVVIRSVIDDGPASHAGLEPLDVVETVDDVPVESVAQLQSIIKGSGGRDLVFRVSRDGGDPVELMVKPHLDDPDGQAVIGVEIAPYFIVTSVAADSPASSAGFAPGDVILRAFSSPVETHADGGPLPYLLSIDARRQGRPIFLKIPVDFSETRGTVLSRIETKEFVRLGPVAAVSSGARETVKYTVLVLRLLKGLFTGEFKPSEFAGPLGVVSVTYAASKHGMGALLLLFGLVSVNLGVFNLIPLPPLDGGLLLFLACEKLRGKPLPQKLQESFLLLGLALLLVLVVLVTWNDLGRIKQLFSG
ncbi:MAG: RIP metalloprotease RseP [Planctomycetes bacterium]|nr:RIP metalloprotease RseP [Planctomycetota bacterium]